MYHSKLFSLPSQHYTREFLAQVFFSLFLNGIKEDRHGSASKKKYERNRKQTDIEPFLQLNVHQFHCFRHLDFRILLWCQAFKPF